jgi:hypothetical protein
MMKYIAAVMKKGKGDHAFAPNRLSLMKSRLVPTA